MPPAGKKKKKSGAAEAALSTVAAEDECCGGMSIDGVGESNVAAVIDVPPVVASEASDFGPSMSDVDFGGSLKRIRKVASEFKDRVFLHEEKLGTNGVLDIVEYATEYELLLMRLLAENERLRGRLDMLMSKEYVEKITAAAVSAVAPVVAPAVPPAAPSVVKPAVACNAASSVGAFPALSVPKPVETWSVVVRSKVGATSKKVIEDVVKHVGPSLGVRVHEMKPIHSGDEGAVIRTPSVAEKEKIMVNKKFEEVGLYVVANEMAHRRVMVRDVEAFITADQFMTELYEKNLSDYMTFEVFRKSVWLKKNWQCAPDGVVNVLLEGKDNVIGRLMDANRVYILWYCFKIKLPDTVPHCFRCLGFDHRVRDCRMKEDVCRKCGEAGHMAAKCNNAAHCRNCAPRGLAADHSMLSYACPTYAALIARANARH